MQVKDKLAATAVIAAVAAGAAFGQTISLATAQSVPVNPTAIATPVTPPQPPVGPPPQSPPVPAPASPNGGRAGVNTSPNGLPSTGTGGAARRSAGPTNAAAFAATGLVVAGAGIAIRRRVRGN